MSPEVKQFREILFWPFRFEGDGGDEMREFLDRSNLWHRDKDWLNRCYRHNQQRPAQTAYGEFVYFHPFVQRFLFSDDPGYSPMQVWRRDDITGAAVSLRDSDQTVVELAVEQVRLFWFDLHDGHGVGIMTLEVQARSPLPLGTVQNLLDQFRRVYPPYWEDGSGGRFPLQVVWSKEDGSKLDCGQEPFAQFWNWADDRRTYPVAKHWRSLLYGDVESAQGWFGKLRQIEDERMPIMAWLAMDSPRALTHGDFVRLCFADDAGPSDTLPYASGFLTNFARDYCYDRYWAGDSINDLATAGPATDDPATAAQKRMTTRYMNCGYAFTMVGEDEERFYANGVSGALAHFRNHYFTMGLIAHFQKAALLSFSDSLSADTSQPGSRSLHKTARKTLRRLIDFTDRYWFVDLSNQIQARELYSQWRGHLGLDALYAQVMDEADKLSSYLEGENQERLEKIVFAVASVLALLQILIALGQGDSGGSAIVSALLILIAIGGAAAGSIWWWRDRR